MPCSAVRCNGRDAAPLVAPKAVRRCNYCNTYIWCAASGLPPVCQSWESRRRRGPVRAPPPAQPQPCAHAAQPRRRRSTRRTARCSRLRLRQALRACACVRSFTHKSTCISVSTSIHACMYTHYTYVCVPVYMYAYTDVCMVATGLVSALQPCRAILRCCAVVATAWPVVSCGRRGRCTACVRAWTDTSVGTAAACSAARPVAAEQKQCGAVVRRAPSVVRSLLESGAVEAAQAAWLDHERVLADARVPRSIANNVKNIGGPHIPPRSAGGNAP